MIETALDIVFSPAVWLTLGLGLSCGLLAFLLRGGSGHQLIGDLMAGMVGFSTGQLLGLLLGLDWLLIGQVRPVPGLVIAILALALRRWLAGGTPLR